jgi:DNA-binding XRE family transcriptional regulator
MTELTKPQIIIQNNEPTFAVIPWIEYEYLVKNLSALEESDVWFPNDVVKANIRGDSLIKAWREYFGLTQGELSKKAGIKQPALARLEKSDANPRKSSLKKLADAMDITLGQLLD